MKFVCENCKAKYQIGDDKVAGKTLRMKCRRCGHMIQVSATVTESSVSKLNPALPHPPESAEHAVAAAQHAPSGVPDLASEGGSQDDESATVVRPSPFFLRQTGTSPAVRAPGPGPRIVPPARPSRASIPPGATPSVGSVPPAPGALSPQALGGAPGSPRPGAVGARPLAPARPGGVGPLAARAASVAPGAGAGPQSSAAPSSNALPLGGPRPLSTPPPSAGLSGGFSRAVAEAPAVPSQAPPTEDWYVGVGGVPLGPVRLSVIREKAAAGSVDGDSLVWREGFEEWQPLKTFPALLALIDEARSARQSRSLTPVPPVGVVTPAPKPANGHAHREGSDVSPFAAAANGAAAGVGTAGASPSSIPGAANGGIPAPATSVPFSLVTPAGARPLDVMGDPFAPPPPKDDADPLALGGLTREPVKIGAFGDEALRPSVAPPVTTPPERKRGVHPMAWAFVAMCAAFGGVAAWAVFLRKPETIVIQASGAPVTTTVGGAPLGPAPPAPPTNLPSSTPIASATTNPSNPGTGSVASGGTTSSKTAKPEGSSAPPSNFDPSGFSAGGPSSGPNANGGSSAGNSQLSQGEIEGVVSRNKPGITRRCWGPAYDARDSNAGKSAKVNVSITVGPSGSVQSASASGGDHFPGLASCIGSSVKAWQFPASDGQTTVNIPFSFNQQ